MATGESEWDVWADYDEGIVYVQLVGHLTESELERAGEAVLEKGSRIDGSVGIINDISELAVESTEEAEEIKRKAVEIAEQVGTPDVVRVVDEDTDELVKMNFEVGSLAAGYGGDVAPSIEAAEEKLGF